ncbi:unnamed protein product [Closterium sp. NIES-54]
MRIPGSADVYAAGDYARVDTNIWSTAAVPATAVTATAASAGRHDAASERDGRYMMSPGKAAAGVAAGGVFTPIAAVNLIDLTERDHAFTLAKSPHFSPDVRDPPPALKPASPLVSASPAPFPSPLASASPAIHPPSPVVINLDDIDDSDSS